MDALSRKRPSSSTDAGPSHIKKRALSSPNGHPGRASPVTNDESDGREPQAESLENFRKEAIFRRMRQHLREKERAEQRVTELEERKRELEGSIGAIENCWNQVLNQLQILANTDSLHLPVPTHIPDLLQLVELHGSGSDVPSAAFRRALLDDGVKTQNLVAAFVSMTSPRPTHDYAEVMNKCQQSTMEATSLRSELHVTHASLVDAKGELERLREALTQAENRVERLQRDSAAELERRVSELAQQRSQTPNAKQRSTSPGDTKDAHQVNGVIDAVAGDDLGLLRSQLKKQETEIELLGEQKVQLQSQLATLEAKTAAFSEDLIRVHPSFVALVDVVSSLKAQIAEVSQKLSTTEENAARDIEQLQQAKTQETAQLASEVASFREKYDSKSREVIKAKDQRDAANREIAILKAAESTKLQDKESLNLRLESLEHRVASFVLEVKRLKAQLAANAGQADLLSFLLSNDKGDVSFVDDLRSKLKSAQTRIDALEGSVASLDAENPDLARHVRAESAAKQEALELREQLEQYKSTFGADPSSDPVSRLREQEALVAQLRLQLQQQETLSTSTEFMEELQRMSSAWEVLEKQSKAKTDDIAAWEAKFSRLTVEKAKADQKYFATMREREALEAERKQMNRNMQQQALHISNLTEMKDQAAQKTDILQRLVSHSETKTKAVEQRLESLQGEVTRLQQTENQHKQQATAFKTTLETALSESEKARQSTRRLEDELARTRKAAEKDALRATTKPSSGALSHREEELESQVSNLMNILRCSTCKHELRSHVLVKCMHTFCKSCIDARLTTRQRRCPACDLKFQDSDVQALFFQ